MSREQRTLRALRVKGYPIRTIRAAILELSERSHSDIARSIGKRRSTVTNAISRGQGSAETLMAIARDLDVQVGEFFPDSRHSFEYASNDTQRKVLMS